VVGRETIWGAGSITKAYPPKRVLVIGAGPAGLEYARIASASGHAVAVYEREEAVGGHVRAYGALPYRQQYGTISTWLAEQAKGNGASIKLTSPVTAENIESVLAAEKPDHIVVATGADYRRDGFQGQTGKPIAGWDTGKCVAWDQVALGKIPISGEILVLDEMADVAAPLTAVKLAKQGCKVRLITKWPMIGMETAPEVYLHWIMTYLYEAEVEIITHHVVKNIEGAKVAIANVYKPLSNRRIIADAIVMATARRSNNGLYHLLRGRGLSVETIGCANAPRTVYEATFEGHRAARKLGASRWHRIGQDTARGHVPHYHYS
jgi:pyruvate/2-oxoglutarate dehydrogenase complex dihydrolipoamide dehydrogenase (E3) component